jgi:hypothetical protein
LPNIVEDAIQTLIGLDAGLPPHAILFDDLSKKLSAMASFLRCMYGNDSYETLVRGTLEELEEYKGKETPKLPHSTAFLKGLLKYGFCITPRMWIKEEILCICISLLDPRLLFSGIKQKDGVDSEHSFRGMAVLDSRVQRIFYNRLRSYGFVNPRWHPERLQSFSSVVINGGGSWKQEADWKFSEQFRFVADRTANPFMIRVCTDECAALEAGGVYVASTTKRNGMPVYVQVSKKEYQGFRGQKGFRDCIKEGHRPPIQKCFLDSKGSRLEVCSPRVLVCCDGQSNEWGIQLLPGFESDLYVFKFNWNERSVTGARRFTNVDFETFTAKMQDCPLSIEILHDASCLKSDETTPHVFSFGTLKTVIHNVKKGKKERQEPLLPQGWHWDGPRVYNADTLDMHGHVRPGAPACHRRKNGCWFHLGYQTLSPYLKDHISIMQESFSALFGMFKETFIETPVSEAASRETGALRVDVPLGTAIVFTLAWKHRGKGDNPDHVVTTRSPVEVHARPHFYVYGKDLRKLPTVDLESTLEFVSICSKKQSNMASQLQVLECLQTFSRQSAFGHTKARELHEFFQTQSALELYIVSQLHEQRSPKDHANSGVHRTIQNWFLSLTRHDDQNCLLLHGDEYRDGVIVTLACFDSKTPSFCDSEGTLYILSGEPAKQSTFPAKTNDAILFASEFIEFVLPLANQATVNLCNHWDEGNLLYLCYILNTRAITDCTLHYDNQGLRAKGKLNGVSKNYGTIIQITDTSKVLVTESEFILLTGDIIVKDHRKQPKAPTAAAGHVPSCEVASDSVPMKVAFPRSTRVGAGGSADAPNLPWLRPCTSQEMQVVADTLAKPCSTNIFRRKRSHFQDLLVFDLNSLKPTKWLNGQVINSYLAIAMQSVKSKSAKVPNMLVESSFLMEVLKDTSNAEFTIQKWMKGLPRKGFSQYHDLDRLLLPYNIKETHWVAIVCDFQSQTITSFDSLVLNHHHALSNLKKFLEHPLVCGAKPVNWTIIQRSDAKCRQRNDFDCGVFTVVHLVLHMLSLERYATTHCTQSVIDGMRQRIAHDIIVGNIQLE